MNMEELYGIIYTKKTQRQQKIYLKHVLASEKLNLPNRKIIPIKSHNINQIVISLTL